MWKEDLRQVYARMLHNYNQKIPICLSVLQNEKKILAMQNVHFQFWQVYMNVIYCIQKSSNDHFHPQLAIIVLRRKISSFSVV